MENPKILIVDDSPSARRLFCELLQQMTARLDQAEDGRQALAMVGKIPYDLIIADVDMPHMDGIELCNELRKNPETRQIPIIIASNFDADSDIERGFTAGASAYLGKKDVRTFLKKTVREILWKSEQVRQRTIMIVDDSQAILAAVAGGLQAGGFKTLTADNGRVAINLLARERPDLIVSDINMPEVDGFELCKHVKADPNLSAVPFVVMSTNDDRVHMDRMMQFGAAAYLVKPFNCNQLVLLIEKILSDHFLLLLKERERLEGERNSLLDSITSLVSALEARDPYTRGHSEAVSVISSEMLALHGAGETAVETLAMAGRLHDIGKIGVRDNVLLKPGRLTREEFDHIKTHPVTGRTILAPIPSLAEVIPIVYSHHERWDGKGYPEGLEKTEIDFWARITAVVDTFHALTSDRPYRRGMEYGRAYEIINEVRETQLCPECVDLFFYWITSKGDVDTLY